MSNSKIDKFNSEGSNRQIYEQVKAVLHGVQGERLGIFAIDPPRSYEHLANSQKVLKEEEIVKYFNGWNPLSSKLHIKKIKDWNHRKREASKEEALVASTRRPQARQPPQEGKKDRKKNSRKPYSPSYRLPRIQKDAMENAFNMARTLMELKDKEEQRMRQPHFPKKYLCLLML
ncbi:hypothetical protein O181_103666 [Austropuccinia psidii MF-1]|uniref:Uncharacterized protein n=1 Tax=Austropuccinia psidii MF-1 TaxID=1389203 RepID=A0A9Q3JL38_9BASI|nr:hypothetical protein [Austropuccinia psidii MF-1]